MPGKTPEKNKKKLKGEKQKQDWAFRPPPKGLQDPPLALRPVSGGAGARVLVADGQRHDGRAGLDRRGVVPPAGFFSSMSLFATERAPIRALGVPDFKGNHIM